MGKLVEAIWRYMFAFSVSNSSRISLFSSNCVSSLLHPFLSEERARGRHMRCRVFVFSLALGVYQSFPSLYHISGLALPYGSLVSLTRLAVLSYLRIAVLCGLDRRCLWISLLLCYALRTRVATSRSRVEPCRTAISAPRRINRLAQNKTSRRPRVTFPS